MAFLIGEADDLVFDARTVTGPPRLDLAGEHRRTVEIGPNQIVNLGCRPRDPADHLLLGDAVGEERKWLRVGIARLHFELREVDARRRQPAGRARLEAIDREPEPRQGG